MARLEPCWNPHPASSGPAEPAEALRGQIELFILIFPVPSNMKVGMSKEELSVVFLIPL